MFNFIDLIVIAFFLYFIWQGYHTGFIGGIFNIVSILISFIAAVLFYPQLGNFLSRQFDLGENLALVAGFFIILIVVEIITSLILNYFYSLLRPLYIKFGSFVVLDRILGIGPSVLAGLFLVSLFLLLPLILPVKETVREPISKSFWGENVLSKFLQFQPQIESYLSRLPYRNLAYLITPEPLSKESVELDVPKEIKLAPDVVAEKKMFDLVNKERVALGLTSFSWSDDLIEVGRKHCLDMFGRGYFSHYTPDGKSPFDRMDTAGIIYQAAGENLAYAPNVDVAHQGLMESTGHKANILREEFGTLGVGVIDGQIHGKMFCQEFTN
ncbi:CvpA family protein [Patescibacteria group bacterium]|nr:CvpA family protein [Patescibacteria group bacterium]